MNDTKIEEIEKEATVEEIPAVEKPYTFRELGFDDIFPMMELINKIGLEKVLGLVENKAIFNLVQGKKPMKIDEEGNEVVDEGEYLKQVGIAIVEILKLVISSFKDCKNELYTVLSNASNLSFEEVSKLPLKHVSPMIVDFIKKDDFKDFFQGLLGSMKN